MRKYLCILLSSVLIFMNISYSVYADVPETYQKTKEYLWQLVKDVGFIGTLPFKGIVELVNEIIHSKGISGEEDVTTEQEALDYAFDGISINGDGNIVLNDNAKLNINTLIDNYVNDNKYYVGYSLDLQYYAVPDVLYNFISENQDSNYVWIYIRNNAYYLVAYPFDDYGPVLISDNINDTYSYGLYNYDTFVKFYDPNGPGNNQPIVEPLKVASCPVGGNSLTYLTVSPWNWNNSNSFMLMKRNYTYRDSDFSIPTVGNSAFANGWVNVSYQTVKSYTIMGTMALFESSQRGYAPYYYNNNVFTDFSSSVGDYTLTNDNSNHVTYGDVTTYIDDHHSETGDFPSIPEINIWIESQPSPTPNPTPTPNPDNPSGGGSSGGATASANNEGINININNNHNINVGFPSLSGNTVSGNGSGSSGGIFDWISNIGGVIGDFIKNVGQLIADVIKGLTETITTVLADIPNIISSLVEFVYGGLPDELKAIVTLGITTVIFVGVIKMMRK